MAIIYDAFFALAMIESRFRPDSKIEHGNTLVDDKFYNKEFDVFVVNPPYGVSWKGYQKDKVMLINASEKFKPLKKSKGSKRKEVNETSRLEIVETINTQIEKLKELRKTLINDVATGKIKVPQ